MTTTGTAGLADGPGSRDGSPPLRNGLLTAIVTVVALASAGCRSTSDDAADEGEPAGSAITTTSIPEEVAGAAIEVVVSAIDAKNRLDLDRWLMAYEGGERQGIPLFADEILMNANEHWEVVEPCQVIEETGSGQSVVECVISNTDDFWGAGGIFDTKNQTFTVNADGLITNKNNFASGRRNSFNYAFHLWLSEAHPDVFGDLGLNHASRFGPGFEAKNADHMLIAVDHVEEFVAESDTYPLDPTDQ